MLKNDIIVIVLVIAFIAVSIGSVISYQQGYQNGVEFQKAQPVDIVVSWYNATETTASFDEYGLTDKGEISIYPQKDITEYNIQKSHLGDP